MTGLLEMVCLLVMDLANTPLEHILSHFVRLQPQSWRGILLWSDDPSIQSSIQPSTVTHIAVAYLQQSLRVRQTTA